MLSNAIRPIVIIARPPKARNRGRVPHLRHAGVMKNARGIPASISTVYARNNREPGTLMPKGASKRTRQAGHFGRNANISEVKDDDINGSAGTRMARSLRCYAEMP